MFLLRSNISSWYFLFFPLGRSPSWVFVPIPQQSEDWQWLIYRKSTVLQSTSPNAWLTFSKYWQHGPKVNTNCSVNPPVTGYGFLLCGEETFSNSSRAGVVFSHLYSSGILFFMHSEQAELQVAMKEWHHLSTLRPKRDSLSSIEKELECTQLLWLPGSQRVGLCERICPRTLLPCPHLETEETTG